MIPDEAFIARRATAWGIPPWELEAALDTDWRALRWWLMAPHLEEFETVTARAGG